MSNERPVVKRFAARMEEVLRANDHKTGWLDMSPHALLERLEEEVAEVREAIESGEVAHVVARECADVANFAMMIADESAWQIGNARCEVPMTTLRELAQAAYDASLRLMDAAHGSGDLAEHEMVLCEALYQLGDWLGYPRDSRAYVPEHVAGEILAALDAEREAPRWQPIDTAPAGVWVMVWGARGTYGTAEPCALVARRDAWGWAEFDGGAVEPTHWQPLPAPPEVTP